VSLVIELITTFENPRFATSFAAVWSELTSTIQR